MTVSSRDTSRARRPLRSGAVPTALLLAAGLALGGCSSDDDDDGGDGGGAPSADADFTLQLLHAADMDGASGALDNVGNFSALVALFRDEMPPEGIDGTVVLSSGDNYIPGPRFFAADDVALAPLLGVAGPGRADIAFHDAIGFQASAVGNHDLDQGTEAFAALIAPDTVGPDDEDERPEGEYAGAAFPYLSSNLDFAADEALAPLVAESGQPADTIGGRLAASATVAVGEETIGIVGATTPALASITSTGSIGVRPEDATDIEALAAEIQGAVDALLEGGIDKVILLAHMQQIAIERELATRLEGVDVIVAGGSNTLLADANDTLRAGDAAADTYPLELVGTDGAPVLVVNTDADYRYLGRLVVGFDENGEILPDSLDGGLNGAWATTDENVAQLGATPIPRVVDIVAALDGVLAERDGNIVGRTAVYLDGRRDSVRTEETNLGDLTADANLWLARQADPTVQASLKNGGGIRSDIGLVVQAPGSNDPADVDFLPPPANEDVGKAEGDVSAFDVQGALSFNNGLTLLTLGAAELVDLLEHAVAATEDDATPGQFPQVAGLRFSFDPSRPAREGSDTSGDASVPGQRIRSAAIVDASGALVDTLVENGALVGDPARGIRIVILDFIASCVGDDALACGDGYPLRGLAAPARVDLGDAGVDPGGTGFADPGSEQDALAEYLAEFFAETPYDVAETPATEDERIQNLAVREDAVLAP